MVNMERTLLGGSAYLFSLDNSLINKKNIIKILVSAIWNFEAYSDVIDLINSRNIDILHIHNFFPLMSPSIYFAAKTKNLPIVQTLHNYRLFCPNGLFLRDNKICEECLGKIFTWPNIKYRCYRNSFFLSFFASIVIFIHNLLITSKGKVDFYIALSNFSKNKFIEGGILSEKIIVKPNFILTDPGMKKSIGDYVLFVGRLSSEKGVHTLKAAWSELSGIPLHIVGDGPLRKDLENTNNDSILIFGYLNNEQVIQKMKNARFLVFSSECYENFPLTIIEAYACGLPILASRIGAIQELVIDGKTGLLFTPKDVFDLRYKVKKLWDLNQDLFQMGLNARRQFELHFSAEKNLNQLMKIYLDSIKK